MHATLGCTKKTETAYDDMSIRHSEASAEPSLSRLSVSPGHSPAQVCP